MGRNPTGASVIEKTLHISLSFLLKKGLVRKGCFIKGQLSWGNSASLVFESRYNNGGDFIRLLYSSKRSGEPVQHDYTIQLEPVASNLGKGEVLYFICPETSKRCRSVFFDVRTYTFVSRHAYMSRLYYRSQLYSKRTAYNSRFWAIEATLEKLSNRKETIYYKGKKTRYAVRLERLLEKREVADEKRWELVSLPYIFRKHLKHLL